MRLTARLACSGEMQPGGQLAPEDPCRTNNLRMDWAASFYDRQGSWTGLYVGDPDDYYQAQAARIARLAPSARTVLELAAGGGQAAAAAADQGHLVTAIELVDRAARNAERLAETRPDLTIIQADMYEVDLGGNRFDAVVYWDGFGLGSDADQIVLLKRITSWLQADGRLLLDAYTPWDWAAAAGQESVYGRAHSRYDFDAPGCRMFGPGGPAVPWTTTREFMSPRCRCEARCLMQPPWRPPDTDRLGFLSRHRLCGAPRGSPGSWRGRRSGRRLPGRPRRAGRCRPSASRALPRLAGPGGARRPSWSAGGQAEPVQGQPAGGRIGLVGPGQLRGQHAMPGQTAGGGHVGQLGQAGVREGDHGEGPGQGPQGLSRVRPGPEAVTGQGQVVEDPGGQPGQ